MEKIKAAVIGASGYSGEELLRLLARHPYCSIDVITSRKYAGQNVAEVFPRFGGMELTFSEPDVEQIAGSCQVAFLALPHGLAAEFARPLVNAGVKVIDISADFRLRSTRKYSEYYKCEHPAPELLAQAVYGLPELYRKQITEAKLIACAGCYPTSCILPSAALLRAGIVKNENIVVASCSGVSGAGRKVDLPYIFPECNESVRAYSITGHRHLPEIEQEFAAAAGIDAENMQINFIPHLVPVNRGINSTIIYAANGVNDVQQVYETLLKAYKGDKFVRVLEPGKIADTKHVTMTNVCEISCAYDRRTNKIIVCSCIDNLTKGASGQAVQCMNISFELPEDAGL